MIYLWQNPSYVLLQELYKQNELREEESKLTFPEETSNIPSYRCIFYDLYKSLVTSSAIKNTYNQWEDDENDSQDDEHDAIAINTNINKSKYNKIDEIDEIDEIDDTYNVFDHDQWSVADIASVLKECGILTRAAGREMDKSSLMNRMKQVYYNNANYSVYKPSPVGHNWIGFWSPYFADIFMTIATVIGTVIGVHYLYTYCEVYHYKLGCSNWKKMYSLECYVLKKSRAYLEEMNYNLVYTTLCGLGLVLAGMLARAKAYATKNVGDR